jgi:hypothetical protein
VTSIPRERGVARTSVPTRCFPTRTTSLIMVRAMQDELVLFYLSMLVSWPSFQLS